MLQNKLDGFFFFCRFTVPLNRTGMTKSSLCRGGGGGVCTQARPEVNMHYRNDEKDSGNSIMKIWPGGGWLRGVGAMTPVAQASAHQSCDAKRQDGRPMLFGFLVIFTHRLTEICILNAENVEKVCSGPLKQMSWPKQIRFNIILTIHFMQPRGMSWRVSRCFKTSVVNVLQLLRPLI